MHKETKTCQNCKKDFTIESEDFAFYEKIKVPPPTWCPTCRMKRRMLFRNETGLHKNKCGLCGKEIISHYSSATKFPVYCNDCWWSDAWDPMDFGRTHDPSKDFFTQWKDLSDVVPRPNLESYQNENSPYSDFTWFSKNVYLSPSTISSDTISYSRCAWGCRDVCDSMFVLNSENMYESLDSEHCANCQYVSDCKDCVDGLYLFDCRNSSDCFMSSNLRNKRFVFRNEQCSKEEYKKRVSTIHKDRNSRDKLYLEYLNLRRDALHRYANMIKCRDSSGNNLTHCKNAKLCFNSDSCEDVKYCVQISHAKDVQDMYGVGDKESSLLYDGVNVGYLDSNIYFSSHTFENCARLEYCDYCRASQDLFGCIGLRKKQYCILNKQYSQKEYEGLVSKIKEHMRGTPYVDARGREYTYGEFFPVEFSPFAYNEAMTQFYFPMEKAEVDYFGGRWAEPGAREYKITQAADDLPILIEDVTEGILGQVVGCKHGQTCQHGCTFAFKITPQELRFYRKAGVPLPQLCPSCRSAERGALRNPVKLWHRTCECEGKKSKVKGQNQYTNTATHAHGDQPCSTKFETAFSPDRKEIIYCGRCYQGEFI